MYYSRQFCYVSKVDPTRCFDNEEAAKKYDCDASLRVLGLSPGVLESESSRRALKFLGDYLNDMPMPEEASDAA